MGLTDKIQMSLKRIVDVVKNIGTVEDVVLENEEHMAKREQQEQQLQQLIDKQNYISSFDDSIAKNIYSYFVQNKYFNEFIQSDNDSIKFTNVNDDENIYEGECLELRYTGEKFKLQVDDDKQIKLNELELVIKEVIISPNYYGIEQDALDYGISPTVDIETKKMIFYISPKAEIIVPTQIYEYYYDYEVGSHEDNLLKHEEITESLVNSKFSTIGKKFENTNECGYQYMSFNGRGQLYNIEDGKKYISKADRDMKDFNENIKEQDFEICMQEQEDEMDMER